MADLVLVRWRDASHVNGWRSRDAVEAEFPDDFLLCHTAGVLLADDDRKCIVAQTWGTSADHDVGGLWCIPKPMVESITVLQAGVLPDAGTNNETQGEVSNEVQETKSFESPTAVARG